VNENRILQALREELDRIQRAIAALEGSDAGLRSGRRKGRKRRLSAAARKRISEAQKARWAKQKKH